MNKNTRHLNNEDSVYKISASGLFRLAVWEDAEFLLVLRNDISVWPQFIQARTVGRQEHLEWFKGVLKRNDVKLFIILNEGLPAGQVRYDLKQDGAYVSIAISAAYRGKGLGAQALKLTAQKILALADVTVLKALIKENNGTSLRCFKNAGFIPAGKEKHGESYFIIMELRKILK